MEYHSAVRKNELSPFASVWMELEGIVLSEISPRKTNVMWFYLKKQNRNRLSASLPVLAAFPPFTSVQCFCGCHTPAGSCAVFKPGSRGEGTQRLHRLGMVPLVLGQKWYS